MTNDNPEVTITIQADGKFKVKFMLPEKLKGQEKEDFLRKVGTTMVHVFDREYLTPIADSFATGDPDSVFVSKFIHFYLHMSQVAASHKDDPDSPVIPPSQMFSGQ